MRNKKQTRDMSQGCLRAAFLEGLEDSKEHAVLLEVLPHLSEGNDDTLVSHWPFTAMELIF